MKAISLRSAAPARGLLATTLAAAPAGIARAVARADGKARMSALAAVLLGSTALGAAPGAAAAAEADGCRGPGHHLAGCARDGWPDAGRRPSCEHAGRDRHGPCDALPTIHAEASATGPVLDLLARDYQIVDVEDLIPSSTGEPGSAFVRAPVVVGPEALRKPLLMALIAHAYQAGLAVAIVNATQRQADRFDMLIDGGRGASCLPDEGRRRIALYALQQTRTQEPPVESRYCLPRLPVRAAAAADDVRGWLRDRFAATQPAPFQEPEAVSTVNLDSLSKKIHCSELVVNAQGQIQQDIFLSSLRSFEQQADYYYVNNVVQFVPRVSNYSFTTNVLRPSAGTGSNDLLGTRLLFTEPSTTTSAVSQYTNSRSTTVSGGVGFSSTGPNVEASVSVTVGTETTVTVPPVTILNTSNLATALPIWTFQPAASVPNALYDVTTSFLWIVDRAVYPNGGEGSDELFSFFDATILPDVLTLHGQCDFPRPFPTWEVGAPEITSVEPPSAQRGGGSFRILGEQMYPSIVSDVLLGGDALPAANFVTLDDQEIRVVVPGGQRLGPTPVQVNTFFNGQTLPSNNDVDVNIVR